ncbi:MAG TPA: type I-E CRISPR-associated protein Cse1/CasA, partial [Spirochaetes bacterium]|nr:type I-E CRISPR-associated protein Cse1/CasA [Spirochaetota bacterium]
QIETKKTSEVKWYKPLVLKQYDGLVNRYDELPENIPVKAFGYTYKGGQAMNTFVEEELPYYHSMIDNTELLSDVEAILKKTNDCSFALKKSLNKLRRDEKNSKGDWMDDGEAYQFWKGLEQNFKDTLYAMATERVDSIQLTLQWMDKLEQYTKNEFDRLSSRCPLSGRGLEKLVKAKKALTDGLYKIFKAYKGGQNE